MGLDTVLLLHMGFALPFFYTWAFVLAFFHTWAFILQRSLGLAFFRPLTGFLLAFFYSTWALSSHLVSLAWPFYKWP